MIAALPDRLLGLLDAPLVEWQKREDAALMRLGGGQPLSRAQFLGEFESLRQDRLNDCTEWRVRDAKWGGMLQGTVKNLSWCTLFCWLPRAAPDRHDELCEVARVVVAMFYIEKMKHDDETGAAHAEARWLSLKEVSTDQR